jgi:hypothetical protein
VSVRGTIGLAATFAVLAALLLVTAPRPTIESLPESQALVPADLHPSSIEVLRGEVPLATFTRSGDGWGDPRIEGFLTTLATLPVIAVIADATATPLDYGLRPDALRLRLREDGAIRVEIEVGGPNPAGTGVYVRRSGDGAVLLAGGLLRWELEKLRSVTPTTIVP